MNDERMSRARGHEAAGEIDEAAATYHEVPPESTSYAEARIRIIGIALLRGQVQDAEREARAFLEAKPKLPESHATLGQVLRLSFRHDAAIEAFKKALELAPGQPGYRMLLNDARRAKYWSPDADLSRALAIHAQTGNAGWSAQTRQFHLRFTGLLNPEFQTWLAGPEGDSELPASIRTSLDQRFAGRFSTELAALNTDRARLRASNSPYAPLRVRLTFASSPPREGMLEDADGTLNAALEVIEREEYNIIPFVEIRSIDFLEAGPYVKAHLTPPHGAPRDIEVPALYYFTEASRRVDLRTGRTTIWRTIAPGFRIGLGLRLFLIDGAPVGLDRIRRIEILNP